AIKSNKDIYEKYHTVNIIRNIFFAEKIEESLNNHNGKVVAVMGGFHSDGVGKILKSKNITYEVVTPSLFQTSSNAKDVYLKHLKNSVDSQTLALRIYLERNDTEQMKELFQVKYAELLASHGLNRALSELNSWLNIISNVTEDDIAEATGNRPENFAKIQDTSVSLNSDGSVKIEFTSILNGKQEKVNFNINDGTPRGGYASLAGWATQKITKFAAFWEWIYMLPFSSFAFGSKTLNKVLSSKLDSDITVEKSSAFDKILDITSVFFLFGIFIFSPPMAVAAYVLMRAALFSSLHKVYYGDIKQHVKLFFLGIVFAVPLIGNGAHYAYNESARQPASIITPSAMSRGSFSVDILIELIDKFQNESPKEVRESDVLNDEFSTIVLETVKHAIPKIKTEDDLMLAFEMLAFLVQSKTWLSASTDSLSTIGPYQLKDRNTSSYERSWLNTEDAETAIAEKLNFLIEDESSKQFGNKNKKSNIYLFKNIEALYFLYFARKKEKLKIYIPEGKDIGYISGYQNSNNRNSVVERTDLLNADKIFFKTDGIDDVFREMDFVLEQYNANNMSLEGKEVFFELNSIERLTDGQRDKLQRYFESQGIKIYLLFPVVSAFSPGSFLKQMLPSQPFVVLSNYSMPNELDKEKVFLERNAGGRVSNYVRNIIFMLLNAEQSGSYLQNEKYYTPGTEILKEGYETFRRLLSFRARKAFDIMSGKENLFTNEGEQVINEDEQNLNIKIKNLFNKALDKLLKSDSSRPELILDVMKMIRNLFVFNALRASNFHNALDTSEKLKTVEKAYMDLALTDIYEYSSEVNIDTKGNEVSSMLCTSGMGVFITLVEYILRTGGLDSSNIILNTSSSYYEYMPYLNNIGLGNWEGAADIIRGYDGDGKKLDDVEIDYGKTNLVLLEPVYNRYDMNVDDIEGFFRKVLIDPSSGERRVFDKPFYVCIDRTAVPLWNIFDIIDELPDNFHVVVYNSLQKLHENSWELATGGGALLISGNNLELHKKFADGMDVTRQACGQVPDVYAVNAFERLFSLGKRMLLQRIKRITSNTETVAKAMAEAAAINPYINKIVSHVSINGQADDMPNLAMPFIAIDPKNKYSFSNPNQKPAAAENDAIADLLALLRAAGIYDAVDRNSYGFDSLTLARYDKGIRVATGDYPAFIANQVASILSGYTSQVLALSKFSDNEDNMDAGAAAEQITQILAGGQYMDTIMFKNHVLKLLNISHQKVKDGDEKYHKLFIVASIAVSMISFDEKRDENYYNKNKPSYKKEIKNIMENTNDDVFEFFMKNLRIAKEIHPYKTRSFMKDFGIDTLLIDKILKNYVAEENAQSLATLRNIIVKILEELNIDITESDKVRIIAERIIKELEIDPALNIMRDIRTAISEKFGIDISKNRDMDKANIGRILQEFNVNIKRLIAANDIRTTDASTDLMFITKDSQGNETEDGRIINTRFFSEMLRAA
ncbi:MAG: DUF1002 domain-containing protein, partial [Endomicrobia bacterium]|nr:DUF1002 domain-containing protein [Endomicrobiia bacterium]